MREPGAIGNGLGVQGSRRVKGRAGTSVSFESTTLARGIRSETPTAQDMDAQGVARRVVVGAASAGEWLAALYGRGRLRPARRVAGRHRPGHRDVRLAVVAGHDEVLDQAADDARARTPPASTSASSGARFGQRAGSTPRRSIAAGRVIRQRPDVDHLDGEADRGRRTAASLTGSSEPLRMCTLTAREQASPTASRTSSSSSSATPRPPSDGQRDQPRRPHMRGQRR